jgi:hypothetical protein
MWAAVGIRQVIQNVGDINESLKSRLVINQCQPNTPKRHYGSDKFIDNPPYSGRPYSTLGVKPKMRSRRLKR